MNEKEMREFMSEGFRNYPSAYDAITLFEEKVKQAIRDALDRNDWSSIQIEGNPKIRKSHGRDKRGYWIYMVQPLIVSNEKIEVEIGIWWLNPDVRHPIAAYACIWGKKGKQLDAYTPHPPVYTHSRHLFAGIDLENDLAEQIMPVVTALTDYLSHLSMPS